MTTRIRPAALRLVALFAATGLMLAACGGSSTTASSGDTGSARLAVPAAQILDFSGPTLEGTTLQGSSLAGTPTVFWFWAPWCTVCRTEAPSVERVAAKYGDKINFVGIPGRGEVPAMKQFVTDTGMASLTHVVDTDNSLWKRFGVTSQPSFAFVDADGGVRTVAGGMAESDLDATVADLLGG